MAMTSLELTKEARLSKLGANYSTPFGRPITELLVSRKDYRATTA
jgi:hypothetical protein